jgi:outer membrane protein OmpA-like peptidoglycan-associated protein
MRISFYFEPVASTIHHLSLVTKLNQNFTEIWAFKFSHSIIAMKTTILLFLIGITTPIFAQQGLQGEYFDGKDFDRKVAIRTDAELNFSWLDAPIKGLKETDYSMRWTGKLFAPVSGVYVFSAKVDDGIRVWVGNKLIIESWQLNNSTKLAGKVILVAGKYYDLKVDYFNEVLGGVIQLFWKMPDAQQPILIKAENYFKTIPKPKVVESKPVEPPKPKLVEKMPEPIKIQEKPKPVVQPEVKITPPPKQPIPTLPTAEPKLEPRKATVLENVSFEQSSYILLSQSLPALNTLVALLKNTPDKKVEIAGHTDNVGDPRLNLALSENRAKVVGSYLIRNGIDENRITVRGYGGTKPISNGQTESDRSQNRRVEFLID